MTTNKIKYKSSHRKEYLKKYLIKTITSGTFANKPFPYMRNICTETGISMNVTREVIADLIIDGYLQKPASGYRLNVAPRYLSNCSAQFEVILLSPSIGGDALNDWESAIKKVCEEKKLSFKNISYSSQYDHSLVTTLVKSQNLILLIPPNEPSKALLSRMRSCRSNLVTLWHDFTDHGIAIAENTPFIGMDALLDHLKSSGCRTVHCVNTITNNHAVLSRLKRWEKFLNQNKMNGILLNGNETGDNSEKRARKLISEYITENNPLPDAFICTSCGAAIGAKRGLYDHNLLAGKDVKLCAYSPNERLMMTTPSITCLQTVSPTYILESILNGYINNQDISGCKFIPDSVDIFIGETTK